MILKKVNKVCTNCKKEYVVWFYRRYSLFCSNRCKYEYKQVKLICYECGKLFIRGKTQYNQNSKFIFCSKVCKDKNNELREIIKEKNMGKIITIEQRIKQSKIMKGRRVSPSTEFKSKEQHPNFIGGTIKIRGNNWNIQRKKALDRDKYFCQRCNRKDNLDVHHIIPYRKTQDNSLENLLTLCRSCHLIHERNLSKIVDIDEDTILITNVPPEIVKQFDEISKSEFDGKSGFLLKWLLDFRSGLLSNPNQILLEQMEVMANEIESLKSSSQEDKKKIIRSVSGRIIIEKEEKKNNRMEEKKDEQIKSVAREE